MEIDKWIDEWKSINGSMNLLIYFNQFKDLDISFPNRH